MPVVKLPDTESDRIRDDLRGLVSGDVRSDPVYRQLYATDASIYEIKPLAIVRPRSLADVVATVKYAAEHKVPIHARGAGTGLAGESLGGGIVVDFSRYMRRILRNDEDSVTLQPGVVHAHLNERLREHDRQFGPDPAMSSVTTIGGVVAIDGGGSHWLKYGSARRHVKQLQLVLADGQVIEAGREPLSGPQFDPNSRKGRLVDELSRLLATHQDLIRERQPQTVVNHAGYQLGDVLSEGHLDLAKLVSGSEGTLALITEITLATQPLPRHRGVALLMFDRLESAAKAVLEILPFGPSACDLMDRRHISLARENARHFDELIPPEAEAVLLVEQEGDTVVSVRDRLAQVVDRVRRRKRLAFHAIQAQDRGEVELFWRLSRKVVPTLYRMKGSTRPLPFIEDLAVPPRRLADFLVSMQNVLKQHQVTASLFAHAGHGQLHLRPFLDLGNPDDVTRMARLAEDLYRETIEIGGSISGEHADGLSRTPFLRQQYGPLVDVFGEVKQIFDPQNIFNPNKIVSDQADLLTSNLRALKTSISTELVGVPLPAPPANGASEPPAPVRLQLNWGVEELSQTAKSCNGCGACRSQMREVRMCPIFRFAPAEESSPRAKANLMRGILTGQLDPAMLSADEFKQVADLCVNCHMCRLECPASVDIPKLMMEGRGAYVRINGLGTTDWLLSRIDMLSAAASRFRRISNWALQNRTARWLMEKGLGIAQGRKLPRLAPKSFMRIAAKRRLTRPTRRSGRKVLYFVDTYANYHDPQLAEAFVEILEHNGVAVYVHPEQLSSTMPMIAAGAIGKAQDIAKRNVTLLAEAVRLGYHIVATEPSAALCLTHEYPSLLDDDDARLVAENSSEACAYLWKLHQAGKLQLDMRPVNLTLGYHMPCHLRALGAGSPGEDLLRLVPGLVTQRLPTGCSGMAGTFGLKRDNYRASLRAGRPLITSLRSPAIQAGTTECSACKMQMEQGTHKATIHPLKILALAYGLMPELSDTLAARSEELVVT